MLDLKPLDAISEDDVFSDDKLLTDYVNACYNAIPDPFTTRDFTDGKSDNGYNTFNDRAWTFTRGQVTADNGEDVTGGAWEEGYSYIRKLNIFFNNIQDSPVASDTKDALTGEMKFIRAFIYARLLSYYGGVPIIEEVFDISSEFSVTRNTYDEVVEYIVEDLNAAVQLLSPSYDGDNTGRATIGAAMALKSRVLLYAASVQNNPTHDLSKWQKAADAAKAVIDLDDLYALNSDYAGTFYDLTLETIWGRQFTKSKGHYINFALNPNGYYGGGWFVPAQSLIDAYETKDGIPVLLDNGTVNPASGYDPQNPYVNRDPRFYATILYNGLQWKGREIETFEGGKDTNQGVTPWNASLTGYNLRKWLREGDQINELEVVTNPYSFFRLAEIYLNYAEALIELTGHDDEAKFYINKVRVRAGMPDITETGTALMKRYRNERRIELAFENHRFFDLLRWKIADQVLGNAMGVRIIKHSDNSLTYEYDRIAEERTFIWPKQYLLPIPRSEITKSNGSLVQNPDYD
jgi:hypothetical protein